MLKTRSSSLVNLERLGFLAFLPKHLLLPKPFAGTERAVFFEVGKELVLIDFIFSKELLYELNRRITAFVEVSHDKN